jgi:hypothetical protein
MEDKVDDKEEQEELLIASVAAFFVATSAPISPMSDNKTSIATCKRIPQKDPQRSTRNESLAESSKKRKTLVIHVGKPNFGMPIRTWWAARFLAFGIRPAGFIWVSVTKIPKNGMRRPC